MITTQSTYIPRIDEIIMTTNLLYTSVAMSTTGDNRRLCFFRYSALTANAGSRTGSPGMKTDGMITEFMKTKVDCAVSPSVDVRGHHAPMNKFDKKLIKEHINSYHPQVSRYNREHAPNRRYLEPNLSITDKWSDFTNKYKKISYELYRQVFESEKITFGEPSQDECEICLTYNLHVKESEGTMMRHVINT